MLVNLVADRRHTIHGSESVTVTELMSACNRAPTRARRENLERGFQANTWRCRNPGNSQRRLGRCRRGDDQKGYQKELNKGKENLHSDSESQGRNEDDCHQPGPLEYQELLFQPRM